MASIDYHKDYYRLLQVDPAANAKGIEVAFKKMSRKHHPDIDKTPGATRRMQDINEAHDVLSDPASRASYDSYRRSRSAVYRSSAVGGSAAPRGQNQTPPGQYQSPPGQTQPPPGTYQSPPRSYAATRGAAPRMNWVHVPLLLFILLSGLGRVFRPAEKYDIEPRLFFTTPVPGGLTTGLSLPTVVQPQPYAITLLAEYVDDDTCPTAFLDSAVICCQEKKCSSRPPPR